MLMFKTGTIKRDYWWWGYNSGWYLYSPTYSTYYMYSADPSLVTTLTDASLSAGAGGEPASVLLGSHS